MKFKKNYDFSYSTEENEPTIGICRATLRKGNKIIERTYKINKNGNFVVQTNFIYNGKANGTNYKEYRFHSDEANTYSVEDALGRNPFGWIEANHEADPEFEFEEQYEDRFEEEIK